MPRVLGEWAFSYERGTPVKQTVRSDRPLGELSSGREVPPEPPENWLNLNRRSRDIYSQLSDDFRRCLIKQTAAAVWRWVSQMRRGCAEALADVEWIWHV